MSSTISSWPVLTAMPFATVQLGDVIDFSDVLTVDDKRLVMALTGYDADATFDSRRGHAVPQLVAAIAIGRSAGILTGAVTRGFIADNMGDAEPGAPLRGVRCAA